MSHLNDITWSKVTLATPDEKALKVGFGPAQAKTFVIKGLLGTKNKVTVVTRANEDKERNIYGKTYVLAPATPIDPNGFVLWYDGWGYFVTSLIRSDENAVIFKGYRLQKLSESFLERIDQLATKAVNGVAGVVTNKTVAIDDGLYTMEGSKQTFVISSEKAMADFYQSLPESFCFID